MSKTIMTLTSVADKAVASAGTRERLVAASNQQSNVTIQWHPSNAGNVYIGGSNVAAGVGLILNAANPVVNISVDDTEGDEDRALIDLYDIWVDAANNGDKVKISYLVPSGPVY